MIQRLQTLYILVGLFFMWIAAIFFPHTLCNNPDNSINLDFINENIFLNTAALIFLVLVSIVSLFAIFKFRNRQVQINYINVNLISIICLLFIIHIFEYTNMYSKFTLTNSIITDSSCSHNWTFDFIYFISFIFFFLAKKSIIKDDELIKSINRIR
tara:strand:+ start:217 stop:684 length:468 start_codon:yes stop_codon:yes gene_type:complete